jgi:hypothetical protein
VSYRHAVSVYFDEDEAREAAASETAWRQKVDEFRRSLAAVDLSLDVHLSAMRDSLADLVTQARKPAPQPYAFRLAATATAGAGGFVVLKLIGPPIGEVWSVRGIRVGGNSRLTVVAGSADLIVTGTDISAATSLAQIGYADEVDFSLTLPNKAFYDARMIPVRYPEQIYVAISGATPGVTYVANVTVEASEDGVYLLVKDL